MDESSGATGRVTRRDLLRALGTGAAGLAASTSCPMAAVAAPAQRGGGAAAGAAAQNPPAGRFGRLFRLRPFAKPTPQLTEALTDMGKPGGMLDAMDDLSAGPVNLIIDPALSVNNPDHPTSTAGATFVGQFVDHDITFDASSRLGKPTAPESVRNVRSPALNLDSVYGLGPHASPQYYAPADRAKLRYEGGGRFEDLPRTPDGSAIIPDHRNDQHVMIAGLHCAIMMFHNRCVDLVRAQGMVDSAEAFAEARRLTTWHFQWVFLHEVLASFIGSALLGQIVAQGRSFYRPSKGAYIPVEFQGAAYRMGHSLVRPSYRANLGGVHGPAFFGLIFDPTLPPSLDPDDLVGGFRAPRRFVGWQTFFDFGDGEVRPNKRIDTNLSSPLFGLPLSAIPTFDQPTVLPQRTLLRHVTWMLPSGQDIARKMGVPSLPSSDLSELTGYGLRLERSTPLWYYVLKEAEVMEGGLQLGPVGGRIVGEVLVGLLQLDRSSYMSAPGWQPTLPRRSGETTGPFLMTDFLAYAGVDPAARGE